MISNHSIYLLIITNIIFLAIGYILGKSQLGVDSSYGINRHQNKINKFDFKSSPKIEIDDKKFVTDIKTDNLERKYDTLGDVKTTEDTIDSSVNKLKNLKR